MKFLHTGDLHLDSPFSSVGAEKAEMRRERQRAVLKKIFEIAKDNDCKLVLMTGDLFDGSFVTRETAELFCRLVESFSYPVVVSAGNHDPLTPNSFWTRKGLPDNLYVFNSGEIDKFDFPELGVEVFGYSFTSAVMSESPLAGADSLTANKDRISLLCIHGEFGVPISRYAPITESDIDRLGVAYAALGHIHKYSDTVTSGGSPVVYCGFAEGRSFDEEGDGGVVVGEINDGKVSFERKIVSENKYITLELDVSDISEREALVAKIREVLSDIGYGKGTNMRLVLTGSIDPSELYDISSIEAECGENISFLEIRNETIPAPNAEYLERDMTIRGELYRVLLPMLNSEDREERRRAARALSIGLAAIDGKMPSERRKEERR